LAGVLCYSRYEIKIRSAFHRINRGIAKFNRWLAPAAVASGSLQGTVAEQARPDHVAAVLGEISKRDEEERDD
jgi:hypothetical protein